MIWSKRAPLGPYPLVLVLDHLKAGFNVGKIVRTANVLGVREVFFVGMGPWDPSLARGALKATRTREIASMAEALGILRSEGYTFFGLHPRGEKLLGELPFPEKTAFILGHEEFGMSFAPEEIPNFTQIQIPQVGVVESLNVSVAASIATYDYLRDRKLLGKPLPSGAPTP